MKNVELNRFISVLEDKLGVKTLELTEIKDGLNNEKIEYDQLQEKIIEKENVLANIN